MLLSRLHNHLLLLLIAGLLASCGGGQGGTTAGTSEDVDAQLRSLLAAHGVAAPRYAVAMVGDRDAASSTTDDFQEYGPRHTVYLRSPGIRLADRLDAAGLSRPNEKNRCFVTIVSRNNQPALFSCGELHDSRVGLGDGIAGAAARSRSKGVLPVTDDLRAGSGNNVMMNCWSSLDNCSKNDAGN